jgi:hypothetical protein
VSEQPILSTLASLDALVFLPVALLAGVVALLRRRRPLTRARLMEVALQTSLLVMMGLRYAVIAVLIMTVPTAVLGSDAPMALAGIAAGVCAAAAALGIIAHRGGVGLRVTGAVVFLVVALLEAAGSLLLVTVPLAARLDAGFGVLVAGGTCLLAAFYWTRRTASPNPLGPGGRPFDY